MQNKPAVIRAVCTGQLVHGCHVAMGDHCLLPSIAAATIGGASLSTTRGTNLSALGLQFGLRRARKGLIVPLALLRCEGLFQKRRSLWR